MNLNYIDIGKRIREERSNRAVSQEKLAEQVGISLTHMSNIENANTKLSLPVFVRIANALGCDANVLLCGNLENNFSASNEKIIELLSDCSKKERLIMIDTLKALKCSLKDNHGKE